MQGEREAAVEQTVVIGGSLSGLFAAAALSGSGRTVTVVDRDIFPSHPSPHSGVPQSGQAHVLLYQGLLAAEQLLPGLRSDLLAAGAVPFSGGDLIWLGELGWLPEKRPGFEILSLSRPLLEHVVRARTLALPGVSIRQGKQVSGLRRHAGRWQVRLADGSSMSADLVVDASGRTSRLPVWLGELGIEVGETTRIDANVGYATRTYASERSVLPGCPGVVVAATPQTLVGGLALRVEHDQWLICAVGFGAHRPPRDNSACEDFLSRLVDPALSELVSQCDPVDDNRTHRQTANVRHHYEKVRSWPSGLLSIGDGLCAFDPVYGQGVTVAAAQAVVLGRAAQQGLRPSQSRRLQRRLAACAGTAWSIATSEDLRFPTSEGRQSLAQEMLGAWSRELGRLAVHGDRRAADLMGRVYNLVGSPVLLAHPGLVASVIRARILGYGPAARRPAALDDLSRMVAVQQQRMAVES